MLIKALWNNALAAKAQLSKQSSFASLLNTNIPMGNKKGQPGFPVDLLEMTQFSTDATVEACLSVSGQLLILVITVCYKKQYKLAFIT